MTRSPGEASRMGCDAMKHAVGARILGKRPTAPRVCEGRVERR